MEMEAGEQGVERVFVGCGNGFSRALHFFDQGGSFFLGELDDRDFQEFDRIRWTFKAGHLADHPALRATRIPVLDDFLRLDGFSLQALVELGDAFDACELIGTLQRLQVVPVVVEPRDSAGIVFLSRQWRVRRVFARHLTPEQCIAQVDEAADRVRGIPVLKRIRVFVNLLPYQTSDGEAHGRRGELQRFYDAAWPGDQVLSEHRRDQFQQFLRKIGKNLPVEIRLHAHGAGLQLDTSKFRIAGQLFLDGET